MKQKLISTIVIILACLTTFGQYNNTEMGIPFLKNFSSKEHKGHIQNFAISQDDKRVIYVANFVGVLEFDGTNWQTITTTSKTKVSALFHAKNNNIYVGGTGEIGYLSIDSAGTHIYISLNNKLPNNNNKESFEVLNIFETQQGICFVTNKNILFYKNNKFDVINCSNNIISSFFINGKLYIYQNNDGLSCLINKQIKKIDNANIFTNATMVKSMLPKDANTIIIATDNAGLYSLNTKTNNIAKLNINDATLKNKIISCGVKLNNGNFVYGTNNAGLFILNAQYECILNVDKTKGMIGDNVNNLFQDKDNQLWVALDNGISRIEIYSQFSLFDYRNSIDGEITNVIRFNKKLYLSTIKGVFVNNNSNEFVKLNNIDMACWDMTICQNKLLFAASNGIFIEKNGQIEVLVKNIFALTIKSSIFKDKLYAGLLNGLAVVDINNRDNYQIIKGIDTEIRQIKQDKDGILWLNSPLKGIIKYDEKNNEIEYLSTKNGLPSILGNNLNIIDGEIVITTVNGIMQYDKTKKILIKKNILTEAFSSQWYKQIVKDNKGYWTVNGDETGICYYSQNPKGEIIRKNKHLGQINDFLCWNIFSETNVTWFCGPEGLIKFDASINKNYDKEFYTIIKKVYIQSDSIIYGGFKPKIKQILNPNENTINFEYTATSFETKEKIKYKIMLEGFDKNWSEWTENTQKEYTNLSPGEYTFKVQAKNVFDKIATIDQYSFLIKTPWYQSAWIFPIYIILFIGLIIMIVRIRSKQLLKEKKELEQIINERTAEIINQKEEIEAKSVELETKNDELEKINNFVKAINNELSLVNLLNVILVKLKIIKSIDRAFVLLKNNSQNIFEVKSSIGWDKNEINKFNPNINDAENLFLNQAEEVFEDIYFIQNNKLYIEKLKVKNENASTVAIAVRMEKEIEGYLIVESNKKNKPFAIKDFELLKNIKEHIISAFIKSRILFNLEQTLDNLKEAQEQLIQSEKLASLGQLTAGIAHEIQNPLNFVNNFSSLSFELVEELKESIDKIKDNNIEIAEDMEDVVGIINDNFKKINEHGKRASSIVKNMLQHSRGKSGEFQQTDINSIVAEYLNLAYHGTKAENKSFNTAIITNYDEKIPKVNVVPQDFSRVILNIVNNACYAISEKTQKNIAGYKPELSISTKLINNQIEIKIHDNGTGIPQSLIDKIYNPFFTTKPTGKGTGLGLSMSYDIITKLHKGKLLVNTKDSEFTEFIITIPCDL